MSASEKTKPFMINIVHEGVVKSIISDLFTFAMGLSYIGVGVFLNSQVLQWIGAIMFFLSLYSRGSQSVKRMTAGEAMEYIKSLSSEHSEAPND